MRDKTEETLDRQKLKRWRDEISDRFKISIKYKKESGKYYYFIENPEKIDGKSFETWILNSAIVCNTLNAYKDLGDRIVCDAVPNGTQYLEPIIQAMYAEVAIDITYRGISGLKWTFMAEPYAVRQHQGQWYLLCKVNNLDSLIVYSLGRMVEVRLREMDYFVIDRTFDAKKYFESYLE